MTKTRIHDSPKALKKGTFFRTLLFYYEVLWQAQLVRYIIITIH